MFPVTTLRSGVAAAVSLFLVSTSSAQVPPAAPQPQGDARQGRAIAKTHCAQCHAIGAAGNSPVHAAPPLRDLKKRYPVESLEEALAEGILTGHATMPEFRFEPDDIAHLTAFLKLGE